MMRKFLQVYDHYIYKYTNIIQHRSTSQVIPNFLHQAQPSHFIDHNQVRFVTTRAGWNVVGTLVHLVAWEILRGTTRSHNERCVFLFRTWEPCIFPDYLKNQQDCEVFVGETYVVHLETDRTEFAEKALLIRCDLLNSQWCSHQQIPESSLKLLCCMSRNKSICWNYFLTWHDPDMLMLYTQSYCDYIHGEWVGSRNRQKQLVEPRVTPLEERRRVF